MSKKFIPLDHGHKIGYQAYGAGENIVFLFHGLVGSSWLNPSLISAIENANLCLIVIERVGYGDSSQFELKSIKDWGPIIRKIVKDLGVKKADVIGISAGAPYAYAMAYFLPGSIKKIWILAGVPAVYEDSILEHYSPADQKLYKSFLEIDLSQLQDVYIKQLQDALENLKERGERHFIKAMEEILHQDCYGMALESKLQISSWGFSLSQIEQPVTLCHAKDDEMVPFLAAKEMSRFLKNCTFEEVGIIGDNAHIKSSSDALLKILAKYR